MFPGNPTPEMARETMPSKLETLQETNAEDESSIVQSTVEELSMSPPHEHNYQLVTVWSAPNYCYRCGNVASILCFDSELSRTEQVFEATKENENMMPPRTAIRYFL